MKVRKRDGRVVDFDVNRIVRAVRASGATEQTAVRVGREMETIYASTVQDLDVPLEVENVQDLVERLLMREDQVAGKAYVLHRDRRARLRGVEPTTDAIADYVTVSKYSRWLPEKRRREVWDEVVDRRRLMDLKRFPDLQTEINWAYGFVRDRRVLPSGRSLQFAGRAIEEINERSYNCSYSLCDRVEFFDEAFFLLLAGCGTGFSVRSVHVSRLPKVMRPNDEAILTHFVDDTIEGWARALRALVVSYLRPGRHYVEFDYQDVRPRGQPLLTSGGKAPGHVPLKKALEAVRTLMETRVGQCLRPVDCVDLVCHVAEAVYAGGIRRASLIALFDRDDVDMRQFKTGDWMETHPHRRMVNVSAVFRGDQVGDNHWNDVFRAMREFGEPGFLLTEREDHGTNPCGEIGLNPVLEDGRVGWAFCNLTAINCSDLKGEDDFLERCRAAAIIGTLQASYTDFRYLGEVTRLVAERDRLLGVGLTGIWDDNGGHVEDAALLRAGVEQVRRTNDVTAKALGIAPAARLTDIAPSGTLSLLLGCVGAGVHPHHAPRYLRRITATANEAPFRHFAATNPHMCEVDPDGITARVTFPILAPRGRITLEDVDAIHHLDVVQFLHENWVVPGTIRDDGGLTHSVSATIVVDEGDWDHLRDVLTAHLQDSPDPIRCLSFLPRTGDKVYPNAPREAVRTEEEEALWARLAREYRPVDWRKMREDDDGTVPGAVGGCEGPTCEVEPPA